MLHQRSRCSPANRPAGSSMAVARAASNSLSGAAPMQPRPGAAAAPRPTSGLRRQRGLHVVGPARRCQATAAPPARQRAARRRRQRARSTGSVRAGDDSGRRTIVEPAAPRSLARVVPGARVVSAVRIRAEGGDRVGESNPPAVGTATRTPASAHKHGASGRRRMSSASRSSTRRAAVAAMEPASAQTPRIDRSGGASLGRGNTLNVSSPITPKRPSAPDHRLMEQQTGGVLHHLAAAADQPARAIDERARRSQSRASRRNDSGRGRWRRRRRCRRAWRRRGRAAGSNGRYCPCCASVALDLGDRRAGQRRERALARRCMRRCRSGPRRSSTAVGAGAAQPRLGAAAADWPERTLRRRRREVGRLDAAAASIVIRAR